MASKSQWGTGAGPLDLDSSARLFFTDHEWRTIDASTARIMPTDHDPGAREAGVVFFIDRYLSGIDYIYATADGSGFLRLEGRESEAYSVRIQELREVYRSGISELDALAQEREGAPFADLSEERQDYVLELLSHAPKPETVVLGEFDPVASFLQGFGDDGLAFFDLLVLHTRQGMYSDPAYGGNRDRVGWKLIGFPGPESLAATNDCSYSLRHLHVSDYSWEDLVPHLRGE